MDPMWLLVNACDVVRLLSYHKRALDGCITYNNRVGEDNDMISKDRYCRHRKIIRIQNGFLQCIQSFIFPLSLNITIHKTRLLFHCNLSLWHSISVDARVHIYLLHAIQYICQRKYSIVGFILRMLSTQGNCLFSHATEAMA